MNRRTIPAFGMSAVGQGSLRQQGITVTSLTDTVRDPGRLQPHYHDFFQLMLLQGRGGVMHDFRDYEVRGAMLLFLAPGQVHALRPRPGFTAQILSFTQAFFDFNAPPPSALFELPFYDPAASASHLRLPVRALPPIVEVFAAMAQEFRAAERGAAEALRAWLRLLFVRIARVVEVQRGPEDRPTRAAGLVRQFQLAVERHFRDERPLSAYAKELGISPNHLNDVVREEVGQSAGSLIRARRVLDAKRSLSHSDLSVSEIGYQLGFADPSYFARFFRRETGSSPAQFRAAIREKYQAE
ncbi:MAG: helix-turn-helix domain-containing protein [Verrucomicrobia bacterium]|nr:helix-turn-helix domain-containing protein [Verrucomicrobiota bacterium]